MPEDLPCGQRGTGRLPHSAIAACVKPPAFHKFAVAHKLAPLEYFKAVSVTRPSLRETSAPTLLICSSRARLQTSSATLRSPQTCCPTSAFVPSMQRSWSAGGEKRCAAETEVRKRPSDSLHGQMSPLCQLRHRRDYGGFRRRVKEN